MAPSLPPGARCKVRSPWPDRRRSQHPYPYRYRVRSKDLSSVAEFSAEGKFSAAATDTSRPHQRNGASGASAGEANGPGAPGRHVCGRYLAEGGSGACPTPREERRLPPDEEPPTRGGDCEASAPSLRYFPGDPWPISSEGSRISDKRAPPF